MSSNFEIEECQHSFTEHTTGVLVVEESKDSRMTLSPMHFIEHMKRISKDMANVSSEEETRRLIEINAEEGVYRYIEICLDRGSTECLKEYFHTDNFELTKEPIKVKALNEKFDVPRVRKSRASLLMRPALLMKRLLYRDYEASLLSVSRELKIAETDKKIKDTIFNSFVTMNSDREASVLIEIATIEILVRLLTQKNCDLHTLAVSTALIDDRPSSGIDEDTVTARLKSLVSGEAINAAISCAYQLRMDQIQYMVKAIFSMNTRERLEAKLKLLSSLRSEIFLEVKENPERTLKRCFSEYGLSRSDILLVLFTRKNNKTEALEDYCVACKGSIKIEFHEIYHDVCPLLEWAIDYLGLVEVPDQGKYKVPRVRYSNPEHQEFAVSTRKVYTDLIGQAKTYRTSSGLLHMKFLQKEGISVRQVGPRISTSHIPISTKR